MSYQMHVQHTAWYIHLMTRLPLKQIKVSLQVPTTLYTRARTTIPDYADLHGITFAELVAFMEEFCTKECVSPFHISLFWD